MAEGSTNTLYYGDNLDILRRYIKDETIDLIYLDPPFNSNQSYNVLFADKSGNKSHAQIKAFEDTWRWSLEAEEEYLNAVETGGRVSQVMQAFRLFIGENDMLAYLTMMASRLVELRRVLKPTGSIYLHCDPTASHYLKVLMDAVFRPEQFQNEIVWKRTSARSDSHKYNHIHDVILFYSAGRTFTWNAQYMPYDDAYVDKFYRYVEEGTGRRYALDNLMAAGTRKGESGKPWRGIDPNARGNHWKYTVATLDELDSIGRIYWPLKGQVPRFKRYLDEMDGLALQSIWVDIPPVSAHAAERLGYPTQKPEALLERIVKASSNEGDTVLDPFCGCGTAVAVAERLQRKWIGIDITHLAISLMKHRLDTAFEGRAKYKVIGEPVSLEGASALAEQDPYQFQWWALGLVGARPEEQKKGADCGIDGRLYFHDGNVKGGTKQIVLSVKAGHTSVSHLRDLRGVLDREGAAIGVLIAMQEPTKPMRTEAASAGFYESPWWNKRYPRIQILTIAELLQGKGIDYPPARQVNATFKNAPVAEAAQTDKQQALALE